MTVRLLAFAASLRKDSLNRKLLRLAAEAARRHGATVDVADFAEFDMPPFNGDLQEAQGFPSGAEAFRRRLDVVDGLLLASPEYNYSLPGHLKNAIDWLSRYRPVPLRGKSALLLATSGGAFGGVRGLWQLRIPLECLGVFVYPGMFPLPKGREALLDDGTLRDPQVAERLDQLVAAYLKVARALAMV